MEFETATDQQTNIKDNEIDLNGSFQDVSRVINSEEINDEEHSMIKGDTIGETLYSSKWILNTLINLSKIYEFGWNESIENDLCTLWDMTAEKEIVEFLVENDFFKMAEFILKTLEEPRLTEIIVGIIGNMCCEKVSLNILVNMNELVSIILSLILSDDKETLIQILRILQATMWDIKNNSQSLWLTKIEQCEVFGEAVYFILKSSTSDELLTSTIDLVNLASEIELADKEYLIGHIFDVDQLISALCEAMFELVNQKDNAHTEIETKNIQNWFNIVFKIIKKNELRFSDSDRDENFTKMNEVLERVLCPYTDLSNLILSNTKCLFSIHHSIQLIFAFQNSGMFPNIKLIQIILTIMVNLETAITENEFEDSNNFQLLLDYIKKYWIEILKITNRKKVLEILKLCDLQVVDNIIKITKSLSDISESVVKELLQNAIIVVSE